jgi:hypothetical protein
MWFDCAIQRPISGGTSGPMTAQRGLVLHHAVANGSLFNTFNNGRVSTQFWVSRSGVIEQYLSATTSCWGTGSNVGNFQYCSVETEGCAAPPHAEPMTPEMVQGLARLYAEGNRRLGWPFQLANAAGANGFAYHRLFSATACPCDVRVNRRQEILDLARGVTPGPIPPTPTPPTEEPEMAVTQVFRPRAGQLSFAQVAGNALWHKWSNNGGESWSNECLISPSGPPQAPVTAKLKNSVVAAGVEDNTMFITTESEADKVYVARQGTDGRWDIRAAP